MSNEKPEMIAAGSGAMKANYGFNSAPFEAWCNYGYALLTIVAQAASWRI